MIARLLQVWWYPLVGLVLVAWAVLTHEPADNHMRLAALTLGGTMMGRAERAYYRSKNTWHTMTAEQEGRDG